MTGGTPGFVPSMHASPDARAHRYVHVIGAKVFTDDRPADDTWERHFLGMHGDVAVWGIDVPHGEDPAFGAETDLFSLFGRVSDEEWFVAGRAVQLVEWARTHRYCGKCGGPTELSRNDRAYNCPSCRIPFFPRLSPAIITLVTRGEGDDEEALLARGTNFRAPLYSCLAGFVEPGENLEQAVVREVREEVGITVGEVTYVASQPWPFPNSLMLGFTARHVEGDIEIDETEISDAQWFRRGDIPMIPGNISIARRLIDGWLLAR
ncbi:MAG: pyrophosphatase [Actinomycetota bacterium]|jgi:NAD+ diphosphatase